MLKKRNNPLFFRAIDWFLRSVFINYELWWFATILKLCILNTTLGCSPVSLFPCRYLNLRMCSVYFECMPTLSGKPIKCTSRPPWTHRVQGNDNAAASLECFNFNKNNNGYRTAIESPTSKIILNQNEAYVYTLKILFLYCCLKLLFSCALIIWILLDIILQSHS